MQYFMFFFSFAKSVSVKVKDLMEVNNMKKEVFVSHIPEGPRCQYLTDIDVYLSPCVGFNIIGKVIFHASCL